MGLALLAYLGVRFFTQGDVATAHRNARQLLNFQKALGLDLELGVQSLFLDDHGIITLANWIYIWGYWPLLAGTLIYLGARHRRTFFELRNAMFISGAIGLVIFATYAVAPPRLFSSQYVDTVTEFSFFYRVAQPPSLANEYAAVPSFHFGWTLLVAIAWYRVTRNTTLRYAAFAMPAAMAFAVVVTANHWILDVVAGALVSLTGFGIEYFRTRLFPPFGSSRLARAIAHRPEELVIRIDATDEHRNRRQHHR
ncbi:MAG: phosphatase PAP2 family protein [Actinomycetota bacterium]